MEEIWKDVDGYEGLYQVSNTGKVRSLSHYARNNINGGVRHVKGRILSQYKMPNGYMQVQFSKNEKRQKLYTHRLVAFAFLNNRKNLSDVNHIDGNKENNSVENLEWVTHKDNQIHMVKNRLTKRVFPVLCVESNKTYNSITEASNDTGIDRHVIKKMCINGNAYKNLHWRLLI